MAAAQGQRALLDHKARSGTFGGFVADWLDEHAHTLPPSIDQLAAAVDTHFKQLRNDGITAQRPVRIGESPHGSEDEHDDRAEPVPENVLLSAQSAGLTTGQLRTIAAAVAAAPQLATKRGHEALMEVLRDVVGPVVRTDDPDDLLDLVSAVLNRQAEDALFEALLDLAANEKGRIAAAAVRHCWELQAAVAPLLSMLRRTPSVQVLGALAETVGDAPAGITDFDEVLRAANRPAHVEAGEIPARRVRCAPPAETAGGRGSRGVVLQPGPRRASRGGAEGQRRRGGRDAPQARH